MKKLLLLLLPLFATATLPMLPVAHAAPAQAQVKWRTFSTKQNHNATAAVKAIQFLLRARGFYAWQPDGVFGAQTAASVKKFQRSKGLKADGVVGARTFPKLLKTVKRGDRGDVVRAAQTLLRNMTGHSAQIAYPDLKVDGIFGAETAAATLDAQKYGNWFEKNGSENGRFGIELWQALTHPQAPQ